MVNNIPLVTVITATYNAGDSLEKTIKSLSCQTYKNIEYIIIDGGSSDCTSEIVSQYSFLIDKYISERDDGIADAWNKGISLASGEYICFLNSGDEYSENFIESHMESMKDDFTLQYGITYMLDDNGVVTKRVDKDFVSSNISNGFGFMHTSCFTSRLVYEKVGFFNTKYKIAIDTEWMVRALRLGVSFVKSPAINYMAEGGVSDIRFYSAQKEFYKALWENDFIGSRAEYRKLLCRSALISSLKKFDGISKLRYLNTQIMFLVLALCNTLLATIPFWSVRKIILRGIGFTIGENSIVHRGSSLFGRKTVHVGNDSVINKSCYIDNRDCIHIGSYVSISHGCRIYTSGHNVDSDGFDFLSKPVQIQDLAVLFSSVTVMPGVKIAEGSVIYPNSVVTHDTIPYGIYGGNPAKFIRTRKPVRKYKMNYHYWYSI